MNSTAFDFLSQSYLDIWNNYQYIKESSSVAKWDFVVITASNEKQADMFRLQIKQRLASGFLSSASQYICIPDPEGKRVGSGGATLSVLREVAAICGEQALEHQRILLIHSGGDSKRVPQYSACGKLFAPVPRVLPSGTRSTLFDEFIILLASLPDRASGGMLVLSGDVLLMFNPLQINLHPVGATAISVKAPVETGSNHGVFLCDNEGHVCEFLHKESVEILREKGAVNAQEAIDIDTGMVWFSGALVSKLYSLVLHSSNYLQFVNDRVRLSLYSDFLFPMAKEATESSYMDQGAENTISDELIACRKDIWALLHPYRLRASKLSPAQFIHFGTTGELRTLMAEDVATYLSFGWSRQVLSNNTDSSCTAINTFIGPNAQIGEGCYLEDTYALSACTLGKRCIVSNVNLEWHDLVLPDETVLHLLPLGETNFCPRLYGLHDNPKEALWFGRPLTLLFQELGLDPSSIFLEGGHTLWDAHLFPVCAQVKEALMMVEKLLQAVITGRLDAQTREDWLRMPRESLSSSFNTAHSQRVVTWQQHLEDQVRATRFCDSLAVGNSTLQSRGLLGDGDALLAQLGRSLKILRNASWLVRIRLYKAISLFLPEGLLLEGKSGKEYETLCFSTLAQESMDVVRATPETLADELSYTRERVDVSLPVRVNWGGGWSDTPPYCFEFGGTVLNAAITLNGSYPIQVSVEVVKSSHSIQFESRDLQIQAEFTSVEDLLECTNPDDPFALHKAALQVCGCIDSTMPSLTALFDYLGGGLLVKTYVAVPKGSGLGISSILAVACIKALYEIQGEILTDEQLCQKALIVEQLMSTGGGWQDQVGGVFEHIKLIKTTPGMQQDLSIQRIALSQQTLDELNERFVLVYSGQRRLARNILREVVGKVLLRDPIAMDVLDEIQKLAIVMAFELERGHISAFARMLSKHWDLSVRLDPGTTNTCIEYIFACCEDLIDGKFVAGAGGGGFLMMILKQGKTKQMLAERLQEMFQESGVAIWECEILN